jgi:clan AA aspartic protease
MMTGTVSGRHALLPVTFRISDQPELTIEFVVDTGYTDYLTLPADAVTAMDLRYLHDIPADLADDSTIQIPVYRATVVWNGAHVDVPVLATGRRPLLGTAMLEACELLIQFANGGLVTVDNL